MAAEAPSFEKSLVELDAIMDKLESGDTTLDDSLASYERGVGLLKQCYDALRKAELRIQKLARVDEEGRPVLEPFEHEATAEAKPRRKAAKE